MSLERRAYVLLLILLGGAAGTLLLVTQSQRAGLERHFEQGGRVVARAVKNSLEVSMLNNAPEDIEAVVHDVRRGTFIGSVSVFGSDGSTWITSRPPTEELSKASNSALDRALGSGEAISLQNGTHLSVFDPIENKPACAGCHADGPSVLGAVGVDLESDFVQGPLKEIAKESAYVATAFLLAGLVITVWAVRRLLKPVKLLETASGELAAGNYNVRLPAFEEREISSVAQAFNRMASEVESHNQDLLEQLQEEEQVLQALLSKTLTVQEEERRRVARELHDDTSQVLSALLMNINYLETSFPCPDDSRGRLDAVKALAGEAVRNVDKIMLDLRPALLDELGLVPALRWYVSQMREAWGVTIEFESRGDSTRLPENIEVAAFRIAQEAISNAARHGSASLIRVRVSPGPDRLSVRVEDDGQGFDVQEAMSRARLGEASGLVGMRERAELLGGRFDIESQLGAGTSITADIPLEVTVHER